MNGGSKNVGNQAPPIALIDKISNVPKPLAWDCVLLIEARNIPKAVLASDAAIITSRRLKKLEKISI
jgi:hypothetical protein